jgi:catechol 2,3-dioxygenase-like lactoylglutathione lyase family enzyme
MSDERPVFGGVHIFFRDLSVTADFYRRLGLELTPLVGHFARATLPNGQTFEFGSAQLSKTYDPGWREPSGASANALQFRLASREAVDALFAELTGAGYNGHLPPTDAYWGARYTEVDDPNGNIVGLQSPVDPARRGPPPGL